MWYRYLKKSSYAIRLWRTQNLKYKGNEYGMTSNMFLHYFTMTILKVWRSENFLRFLNAGVVVSLIMIKNYYDSFTAEERKRKKDEQANKEKNEELISYLDTLQINRYGIATNPGYSVEDFLAFVVNGKAIDDLAQINDVPEFQKVSFDLEQGLDTWIGDEDRKLLKYYNAYQMSSH